MAAAAFSLFNAEAPTLPVLLSVPHAGRDYPADLLANLRVPAADLLRLEDRYADRLVQPAIAGGVPAIIVHRARAFIDMNRAENDVDVQMLAGPDRSGAAAVASAKTRGGLGLIPRRLQASGELWRRPLPPADLAARIESVHRPFHGAVGAILANMRDQFGIAILLDVHSMPPIAARPGIGGYGIVVPRLVVGDRFGRSAASLYSELILAHVRGRGIEAALNNPYSGDFILGEHGRPQANIHALQLEIDRSLYLDSAQREPSEGLAGTARLVQDIALLLADQAMGPAFAQAAE